MDVVPVSVFTCVRACVRACVCYDGVLGVLVLIFLTVHNHDQCRI